MIPFADHCLRVERHIEQTYGIRVITRDIPDPLTGDLNGAEIHIDNAVTSEQRLFLLAHLFGHTVQWNVDPNAYDLGQPRKPPVSSDCIPSLMDYEREAASYAVCLLHEAGVTEDQWFSNYAACDAAYLHHFYVTGKKQDFQSFWRDHSPLVDGKPVPPFHPLLRALRSDGIVI